MILVCTVELLAALFLTFFLLPTVEAAEEDGYFEGVVEFAIEVEPLHPDLSIELLQARYGTKMTKYFANGNYKKVYENGLIDTVWFVRSENREYTLMAGESVLLVARGEERFPGIVRIGLPKDAGAILGHEAKALKIWFDDGAEATYWYSEDLGVDPQWFADYRIAGFDAYYEQSRSVILGYERKTRVLRRRESATRIQSRDVTDAELALPDLPVVPLSISNVTSNKALQTDKGKLSCLLHSQKPRQLAFAAELGR